MMQKLSDALRKEFIALGLVAGSKEEALRELIRWFSEAKVVADAEPFFNAVMAREKLQSTGIGGGVAIPHARSAGVRHLTVMLGRFEGGVDFAALDGQPVQLVFLIAAPQGAAGAYIQTVAKVARLLKSRSYKESLLKAKNPQKIADLIDNFDRTYPRDIQVKKTKDGRVIHP
jgi:PTS system fructose-specific IIC component